jgi:hypothetical protein
MGFALFYILLIIGQWLLSIIVLLPPIFLNWYVHLPTDQYCLVPYTALLAEMYHIMIIYTIPLVCISIAYVWVTIFIRDSSRTATIILTAKQRQRNSRDFTVIKRIVVIISILIAMRFPTVIFMIYAVSVGHLYPLTFGIVGLITSICFTLIGLITIHITSQLRENLLVFIIRRDNRVRGRPALEQRLAKPAATMCAHVATAQQNTSMSIRKEAIAEEKP